MKHSSFLIVLLSASFTGIFQQAAAEEGNETFPIAYPPKVVNATGQTCPTTESARAEIDEDVRTLINTTILPLLELARDQYCPCSACGRASGWSRIAYLNMSEPTEQCPPAWQEVTTPVRACRRRIGDGCSSATFSNNGVRYSQVCGRVTGHRRNRPDGFSDRSPTVTIDQSYVDGVSITHGSPRQHVWTFAAAFGDRSINVCPCTTTSGISVPQFVGDDYFCENSPELGDPLWDGEGCGTGNSCECTFNNPPWFCQELQGAVTDDIEIRICGDQSLADEQTPVEFIEIYVS